MKQNGRTAPFPGFSRGVPMGVPLIGQRPKPEEPPPGAYFYQVPILIQRPGEPLEADTFQCKLTRPMEGAQFNALTREIAANLKAQAPERPEPKVIALAPFFLGFVPQEVVDKAAAAEGVAPPKL